MSARVAWLAAILFDADGVLLDSMESYWAAWSRWGDVHGIGIDVIWPLAPGRRPTDIMSLVAAKLDPHHPLVTSLQQSQTEDLWTLRQGSELSRFTRFLDDALANVKATPGAQELLRAMAESQWCIATSGYRSQLVTALRAAGLQEPKVMVTAEDVPHGKPSPDCYVLAATRLGVLPNQSVVIEDAPAGIVAARAAGMRCIAIATTHPKEELEDADQAFDSLASASDLILALARGDRR